MSASGLTAEQEQNANAIIAVAKGRYGSTAAGQRAALIGIMTAITESGLINVNYGDLDSLGLFQQRASWGSATDRTNPTWAATAFYNRMDSVASWQTIDPGVVAQTVQVSAFPDRYDLHQTAAQTAVNALFGEATVSTAANTTTSSPGIGTILGMISSEQFWIRAGLLSLGSFLVLVALVRMVSHTKAGSNIISSVKESIPNVPKA